MSERDKWSHGRDTNLRAGAPGRFRCDGAGDNRSETARGRCDMAPAAMQSQLAQLLQRASEASFPTVGAA